MRKAELNSKLFIEFTQQQTPLVNEALEDCLVGLISPNHQPPLHQAMLYTVLQPSKRFRPLLTLAACQAVSRQIQPALEAAVAVELAHNFSLIHDDLPALDNDDLRRGQPSNHKLFGEAQALLAGDALLVEAFSVLSKIKPIELSVNCSQELSQALGARGMILGASLEISRTPKSATSAQLKLINQLKTAKLIQASLVIGGLVGRAPAKDLKILADYGLALGQLFQITDDLLDCLAPLSQNGLTKQRALVNRYYQRALDNLTNFGQRAKVLASATAFVRSRVK